MRVNRGARGDTLRAWDENRCSVSLAREVGVHVGIVDLGRDAQTFTQHAAENS